MPRTWHEKVISYAGNLDVAAQEVIAELDEQDGIVIESKSYKFLIRAKAREYGVGPKDLAMRVREYLE